MTVHTITPFRETMHGTFSSTFAPVLTIEHGDSIEATTLDARWSIEPSTPDRLGEQFDPRDSRR